MNNSCFYCEKDERLDNLMMKISELQTSILYLNKDQTHSGRSILALQSHKRELFELSNDERQFFMEDLSKAAKALQETFAPQKINYAIYGDVVSHLHVHLVPKYEQGPDWGGAFVHDPPVTKALTEQEYKQLTDEIQQHLKLEEVKK
ncbi:histidine triad (HIT) protein [Planococcus donghaensis MPA1U2]|uniref:Histidine triad (HIT) protein n=1 Tax=Planococcus donghaensis MPA1U2 TaxID=933115 RepID=E7RG65_9BACL|nr:HIT family protein [Planococcus donghaensis]EGA90012.1 histidine triad (HIT) protein [Planococcus donghaensis MPA1U2]